MKAKLSQIQIIALGFAVLIAAGTALLCLPVSTRSGEGAPFLTALFTAASASCVTGLVLQDTATYWSGFGQGVILLLIQVGGLGVMTIATVFFVLLRRKIGLRQREVMVESLNSTQLGGILMLLREIVLGTAILELAGTLLLAIRFVPRYGPGRGLWYSLFHAVSAFCNAGFDLMGGEGEFSSLTGWSGDALVNITIMALVVTGGLGFLVWDDVLRKGFRFSRFSLQSKIVLSSTAAFILGGALLFWGFEHSGVQAGMGPGETVLTSLFASVTARTAGFNTVDTGVLTGGSKLLLILLMFIGGSPGSTAGGVKTTTVVVILAQALAVMRHQRGAAVFGRRIDADALHKAVCVLFTNLTLAIAGTLLLSALQPQDTLDVMFEVFSAIGTVGMSAGLTQSLCTGARWVIILLMYLGRLGSVSFALALLDKRARPPITCPTETITIG